VGSLDLQRSSARCFPLQMNLKQFRGEHNNWTQVLGLFLDWVRLHRPVILRQRVSRPTKTDLYFQFPTLRTSSIQDSNGPVSKLPTSELQSLRRHSMSRNLKRIVNNATNKKYVLGDVLGEGVPCCRRRRRRLSCSARTRLWQGLLAPVSRARAARVPAVGRCFWASARGHAGRYW